MENKTQKGHPEDGGCNDLGTAYVREAGCGVLYIINLEDSDEQEFEVVLDREQVTRLRDVCNKLLNEGKSQPPAPWHTAPPTPLYPNSLNPFWRMF